MNREFSLHNLDRDQAEISLLGRNGRYIKKTAIAVLQGQGLWWAVPGDAERILKLILRKK